MKKIGLVLGGGGSRGSYQLGVLKALYEHNLLNNLKVVAGTSIGSINGCLVIQKLSFEEMLDVWKEINNKTIYKDGLSRFKADKLGLYDQTIMYDILVSKRDDSTIKTSDIKGYAAVTKINDYKLSKVFTKADMESMIINLNKANDPYKVILASASIPVVFGPTEIDGEQYLDGGLLNNLPINALNDEDCDVIILVGLEPHNEVITVDKRLVIDFSPVNKLTKTSFGMLDFNETTLERLIEEGYNAAQELIASLKDNRVITNNEWNLNIYGSYTLNTIPKENH